MKYLILLLTLCTPLASFGCTTVFGPNVSSIHDPDEVVAYVTSFIWDNERLTADEKARFNELFFQGLQGGQPNFLPYDEADELKALVIKAEGNHLIRIEYRAMGCMLHKQMSLWILPNDELEAIRQVAPSANWDRIQKNGIIAAGIGRSYQERPTPHWEYVINVVVDETVEVTDESGYKVWGIGPYYRRTPYSHMGFSFANPMFENIPLPVAAAAPAAE